MMHHPIFYQFERVTSTGSGKHIFDFIGSCTQVAFKHGWEKHALPLEKQKTPNLPPVNEHYFDWIATLQAVNNATETFRMAELGAGYAPWLARAALACRQRDKIKSFEFVAVEADPTRYEWTKQNLSDNGLDPEDYHVLKGAVSDEGGILRFPAVDNPDEDYGTSLRAANTSEAFIEVQSFSLAQVLDYFSGAVDFIHVDIQGAEYDTLPPNMDLLKTKVKTIMIGTHVKNELHHWIADVFQDAGWRETMNFTRNELVNTEYGDVQFGDGFLLFENPSF